MILGICGNATKTANTKMTAIAKKDSQILRRTVIGLSNKKSLIVGSLKLKSLYYIQLKRQIFLTPI